MYTFWGICSSTFVPWAPARVGGAPLPPSKRKLTPDHYPMGFAYSYCWQRMLLPRI